MITTIRTLISVSRLVAGAIGQHAKAKVVRASEQIGLLYFVASRPFAIRVALQRVGASQQAVVILLTAASSF